MLRVQCWSSGVALVNRGGIVLVAMASAAGVVLVVGRCSPRGGASGRLELVRPVRVLSIAVQNLAGQNRLCCSTIVLGSSRVVQNLAGQNSSCYSTLVL